jgi:hypothetical protein
VRFCTWRRGLAYCEYPMIQCDSSKRLMALYDSLNGQALHPDGGATVATPSSL